MHRVTPRLGFGFEYNPAVSEVVPTANWVALKETESSPLLTFGLSSDRIFTEKGDLSLMATVAKSIPGTSIAPYVGVSYSGSEKSLLFPAGINYRLDECWDYLAMFDGRNGHVMLTYSQENWNVTGLFLKGQRWGVSVGIGF
jgi:hypothetical protein